MFNVVPRDQPLPGALNCDTRIVFSREKVVLGTYPAIDPINSRATFAGSNTAHDVRELLGAAARLEAFFAQPLRVAESYTGQPSTWVEPAEAEAELLVLLPRKSGILPEVLR